jgi:hypothetical protein
VTPIIGLTPKREVDQVKKTGGKDNHGEKGSIASDFLSMDFIPGFSRFNGNPSQPVVKHQRQRPRN